MVRPEAETGEALSTHRPASLPHTLANNGKPEMRMHMRTDELYTLTDTNRQREGYQLQQRQLRIHFCDQEGWGHTKVQFLVQA